MQKIITHDLEVFDIFTPITFQHNYVSKPTSKHKHWLVMINESITQRNISTIIKFGMATDMTSGKPHD